MDKVKRNPGCLINIVRPNPLLSAQEGLHPGTYSKKHKYAMISQQMVPFSIYWIIPW